MKRPLLISILASFGVVQSWTIIGRKGSALSVSCRRSYSQASRSVSYSKNEEDIQSDGTPKEQENTPMMSRREALRSTFAASAVIQALIPLFPATAEEDNDTTSSFASISARATQISQAVENKEAAALRSRSGISGDLRTVYDFSLPVQGQPVPFAELIRQEFIGDDDRAGTGRRPAVKAIIVVNIKQDDPFARKTIPELITLASRYGRNTPPDLAIVACPTDQGYYEPDTSQLIRLKLASEYGYGINPSTTVTDKVNLLGTGAHPFWRFLQLACRNPLGLGRIQGNFEKFLIDGRSGLPVRRYPRKYPPSAMAADIEALLSGKPLPPAQANYMEEWRVATAEAERDTYRFEKGLNYFDQ